MYNYKYNLIKNNKGVETSLYAKFRFVNEVAPKDRNDIRSRIQDCRSERGNTLLYYLKNFESYQIINWRYLEGDGRRLYLKHFPFDLGFSIKITSDSEKSLENMLNLGKLNEFILTKKI